MDLEAVEKVLGARGERKSLLERIRRAVFFDDVASYAEIPALSPELRKALEQEAPILSVTLKQLRSSGDGRAHKAALSLRDGTVIETVLLKPRPKESWSVCVSSQVGCAIGCTFCATGLMGLARNLTSEEITDQLLFWRQRLRALRLPGRVTNVVYMGMGEPFHNYEPVAESLRAMLDEKRLAIGTRHLSVSTAGILPGIERFLVDFPQVNLAVSLHSADDTIRDRLVPLNRAFPLAKLAATLRRAIETPGRKIFLEYVLLEGENDGPEHARQLIGFIHSVGPAKLLHVNLIVWNPTDTPHRSSSAGRALEFQALLDAGGLRVTIRKNLGTDIDGACGQLISRDAAKVPDQPRGGWREIM